MIGVRAVLIGATALVPIAAWAQPQSVVPAINNTATNTVTVGLRDQTPPASVATARPANAQGEATKVELPPGMPPPVHTVSPSASLNAKEKASATMAAAWRNRNDRPARGEDGVLRWIYGASLPSVVCAPLQVCDIALQPGEVVTQVHVGDKVRWSVMPGVTGFGSERTTHLIVKPSDAGLVTSLLVMTSRREYSIKLIATQSQWTPMTGFTYPESAKNAWASYGAMMNSASGPGSSGFAADARSNYTITGKASWKPERAYSSDGRTIIQFPSTMRFGSAPVLLGLNHDGSWFSSPSQYMLRYRFYGNQMIVDSVIDRAELVVGVDGSQQKVEIERNDN